MMPDGPKPRHNPTVTTTVNVIRQTVINSSMFKCWLVVRLLISTREYNSEATYGVEKPN